MPAYISRFNNNINLFSLNPCGMKARSWGFPDENC